MIKYNFSTKKSNVTVLSSYAAHFTVTTEQVAVTLFCNLNKYTLLS